MTSKKSAHPWPFVLGEDRNFGKQGNSMASEVIFPDLPRSSESQSLALFCISFLKVF
jgi:hypothetical protein